MKKIIAIFISIMVLSCICGCRKTPNENFSNTSSIDYNSSVDNSMFEDDLNSDTTQMTETSADETTSETTVATPTKSTTVPVSSNETIEEQPTPTAPTESTVENTDSNTPKEPSETGTTTSDEMIEVRIGNRIYRFAPSAYGQCDKCGLPAGMIIPHEDYTCEQCGETCCDSAFYSSGFDGWVCPFCNYAKEREKTYCPNCGRVRGDGKNGTCAAYEDPFTGKWVCQHFD